MTERSALTNSTAALAAAAAAMASSNAAAQMSGTDWGGFYVGGNAGVNFLHTDPGGSTDGVSGYNTFGATALPSSETVGTSNGSGGMLGGQAGFNWQQAQWVYGGELGFSWLGNNTVATHGNVPFGYTRGGTTHYNGTALRTSKAEGLFTMRARIGEDFNGTMPYVIGGFALAQVKSSWQFIARPAAGYGYGTGQTASKTSWLPGFAIGAGIEQKLGSNWSVRGEFSWMQFQKQKVSNPVNATYATGTGQAAFKSTISTFTLGLNYRF